MLLQCTKVQSHYHLEKMKNDGLLSASSEKPGSRPEKTIYAITDKGMDAFKRMLSGLLEFEYRPTFPSDGVFYFSGSLNTEEITDHLDIYIKKLEESLAVIQKHKNETLQYIPEKIKTVVLIIFSHHEHHYQAELSWAQESLNRLKG